MRDLDDAILRLGPALYQADALVLSLGRIDALDHVLGARDSGIAEVLAKERLKRAHQVLLEAEEPAVDRLELEAFVVHILDLNQGIAGRMLQPNKRLQLLPH